MTDWGAWASRLAPSSHDNGHFGRGDVPVMSRVADARLMGLRRDQGCRLVDGPRKHQWCAATCKDTELRDLIDNHVSLGRPHVPKR